MSAITHKYGIKERLDNCSFPHHTAHIQKEDNEETLENELQETDEEILMWEDILDWMANNIIKNTCFASQEEPNICTKQGANPPKRIPHKCTHGYCEKCLVEKLLKVMDCPTLSKF